MKKVAIVSCYFKKNYGSLLQAYATQKILDKLNIQKIEKDKVTLQPYLLKIQRISDQKLILHEKID